MLPMPRTKGCWLAVSLTTALLSPTLRAELRPVSDSELSDVVGQAYISIDQYANPDTAQNTKYTRINLGMDVETMMNVDTLELGRYEREGEKPGSSDVLVNDFALGYIYDSSFYTSNPDAVRPIKPDGSNYQNGEIVPFKITDPYLEFAFDETTGQMTGVRIGYGEAQGVLSGRITYLTGNVNVDIVDHGEGLSAASSDGNFFDQVIVLLTPLLEGDSPIQTHAKLVDQNGNPDPVRAEYIGVPNGEQFSLTGANAFTRWSLKNLLAWGSSSDIDVPNCSFFNCPGGDINITVQDCLVLGIASCFDLGIYNSFPIGEVEERNGKRYLVGPASGFFMSFQTKSLQWLKDVKNQNSGNDEYIQATSGAFFNIPNSATQVNLEEALYGTDRVRTEYIDRGRGLF